MGKTLTLTALALACAAALPAAAQQSSDGNWLVRGRAVSIGFDNGQSKTVKTLDITADDRWIPELDITYFFTKNLAAELVLTYPQNVDIKAGSTKIGTRGSAGFRKP